MGERSSVKWIVLKMPIVSETGKVIMHEWDREKRTFRPRNSKSPTGVRYGKKLGTTSQCSVSSKGKSTSFAHYYCEIDDHVLHELSLMLGLPVITNDRALKTNTTTRSNVRLDSFMRELMNNTTFTVLKWDGFEWDDSR